MQVAWITHSRDIFLRNFQDGAGCHLGLSQSGNITNVMCFILFEQLSDHKSCPVQKIIAQY